LHLCTITYAHGNSLIDMKLKCNSTLAHNIKLSFLYREEEYVRGKLMTLSLPTFSLFEVKPGLILRPLICMPAENLDDSKEDSCSKLQKKFRENGKKFAKKIRENDKKNRENRKK
jgi:hypothetical protein